MRNEITLIPSKKECILGLVYLFLEMVVLPVAMVLVNNRLARPLSVTGLNCLLFAVNFVCVAWIFRRFLKATLAAFRRKVFSGAGLGMLVYFGGNLLVSQLIFRLDPDFLNVNDSNIAAMAGENFWLLSFCTVLLVPITEELLFRGVLFGGLFRRSPAMAYAVSTAVFCLVHVAGYVGLYPPGTLLLCCLQYIPAGLALAWAWHWSGSILSPILMHTAINAIGMLAMR